MNPVAFSCVCMAFSMPRHGWAQDVKGIRLPPTLLFDHPTVNAVLAYISGKVR